MFVFLIVIIIYHNPNDINNNSTYTNTKHYWQTQIHRQLCCTGTNVLLLTSDFGSSTRGETQFLKVFRNHTMLTTPQNVQHISWSNLNFSTPWSDPTSHHHGRTPTSTVCLNGRELNCLPTWSKVNSRLFFKIFKFSEPLLPGMTSFTLQLHFLFGVYYDNCDCHILCARA